MNSIFGQICISALLLIMTSVAAQSKSAGDSKNSVDEFAKVGKMVISKDSYDQVLKAEVQKGRVDNPQLRQEVTNRIINQELLMQEIAKRGLDKKAEHREALQRIRQNYLIEVLFRENLAANPITDAELKSTYDLEFSPKSAGAQEYKLKELVYSSEKEASAALQKIKKGDGFDKLWTEQVAASNKKPLDSWLSQNQLTPAVASVIVYLSKGSYTLSPVQIGNRWLLIKVEDVRSYKAPEYEQVKKDIYSTLVQRRNAALIQKIRATTPVSITAP